MTQRHRNALAAVAAGLLAAAGWSVGRAQSTAPSELAELTALQQTLRANLQAANLEEIDKYMGTIHPEAPIATAARRGLKRMAALYELKYELVSFKLIGLDAPFAFVRVSQRTTKLAGGPFRDNTADVLHVLRKDDGTWKLWQSVVLGVEYHPAAETP